MARQELNPNEQSLTAKEKLFNYLEGIRFGTIQYLAFYDHLRRENLERELLRGIAALEESRTADLGEKNGAPVSSWFRIAQVEVALQQDRIMQRRGELPGYHQVYQEASVLFDALSEETYEQVRDRHPDLNENLRDKFYFSEKDRIFMQLEQKVYEKAKGAESSTG